MMNMKIDEHELSERLKIKIETEKLKKVNKIEGHKIKIESIKDTKNRETKELKMERINKLNKIKEIKTVIEELGIELKFNESANNLDIRLIKGAKNSILNNVKYKNLWRKPIDLSLENKCITFRFELPFGIIYFSSYVNIETINIISPDVEMNKPLANNPIK